MASKNKKGEWEFDDDDEARIAMIREANKRDREAEAQQPWDKTTERRKNDRRKPTPQPKKKSVW